MINKIYKSIHNKYSNNLEFFFYLKFVFTIFLVASSLFILVPKFFNYEKKQKIIKEYLFTNYDLEIKNFDEIKFKVFPTPNLLVDNVNYKIKDKPIIIKSNNIKIFLDLKDIYNYENFKVKKLQLINSQISIDIKNSKILINYLNQLKYKLNVKDLNLNLTKNNISLIKIKNLKFSNYGYTKYSIKGEIFEKKFKALFQDKNKTFKFDLLNTGFNAKLKFNEKNFINSTNGHARINILNNLIKFDFILDDEQLEIKKSNFRNKNYSFSLDSLIKYNPFFNTQTIVDINFINKDLVSAINVEKILEYKNIIKKLNSKIDLNYKNKNLFINIIENFSSTLNLAYGRLSFINKFKITGGEINFTGDIDLIDEYPRLNFICNFNLKEKKKLYKKLSISKKLSNNKSHNLYIEGSLNLLKNKINFKKISTDKNFIANTEDMKYFKNKFESHLLNESFFGIFKLNKIKEFLLIVL